MEFSITTLSPCKLNPVKKDKLIEFWKTAYEYLCVY